MANGTDTTSPWYDPNQAWLDQLSGQPAAQPQQQQDQQDQSPAFSPVQVKGPQAQPPLVPQQPSQQQAPAPHTSKPGQVTPISAAQLAALGALQMDPAILAAKQRMVQALTPKSIIPPPVT